jgi:hypothetical protein
MKQYQYLHRQCAYHIFDLDYFESIDEEKAVPVTKHPQGGTVRPLEGSVLIWRRELRGTGHVAIITRVGEDYVDICEQNWDDFSFEPGTDYARRLQLTVDAKGRYTIVDCLTGNVRGDKRNHILGK